MNEELKHMLHPQGAREMKDKIVLNDWHWRKENYRQRITTKEWSQILLNGKDTIIYKGNLVKLMAIPLGYGIVEVTKNLGCGEVNKEQER